MKESQIYQRCYDFYTNEKSREGETWNSLAQEFQYPSGEALRSAFRRELKRRNHATSVGQRFKDNGTVVSEISFSNGFIPDQLKDSDYLLQKHGFNPNDWEIIACKSVIRGDEGECQSRISVRPKKNLGSLTQEDIEKIYNELSPRSVPIVSQSPSSGNKLLVASVSDLHFGRFTEKGISGEDYNLEIAALKMLKIIQDDVNHFENRQNDIEEIVFFFLSDFFNTDNVQMTTTKGTPQMNCVHPQTMFKEGANLAIACIDKLQNLGKVRIPYVESNHDTMTSYHLALLLKAWYRNNDNVYVDTSPVPRKYIRFGNTLLGFSHGHNDTRTIPYVMASEASRDWGETKYHEFLCGHLHREITTSDRTGAVLRHLSAPVPQDLWGLQKGLVTPNRKSQALLYDKENGLEEIFYT